MTYHPEEEPPYCYHVLYADGDKELMAINEMHMHLIKMPNKAIASHGADGQQPVSAT